ncbi:GNAT family N-acetyltransferase [Campylobacter sp. VBCF_06 NA8]|uniref:GNAT family N-acetyltransferase n=1 Tax=unclassified Campylobacter TaxID=2593542 RepID=UPI0022E9D5CA|nr:MULTISPECIES: GNAT family N-acetyltransferase [unclassified Campylobacter]MDA3046646.1 GNAT family N-acetyltransferase [Campylobacter sp. VBCF_06 NA8]MDA3076891.1 GNAT family N-acetyltransferase [Campylobacter sp. JMF_04 NA10]
MIVLEKPRLCDIGAMQEMIKAEVESGVILPRSDDEIATYIRSYTLAYVCDEACAKPENTEPKFDSANLGANSSEISNQNSQICASYTQYFAQKPQNAELAGYASLKIFNADLAEIRSFVVSPKFRRRGIGSKIVKALLDEAKFYGLKNVFALTYQKHFFEQNGFKEISKDELPAQKIWADCISCKKFPVCNEVAVIYTL